MKTALAVIVLFSLIAAAVPAQTARPPAQPRPATVQPVAAPAADPNLNAILADLQRVSLATNGDLSKLRIEKWKADGSEKQQMQQVADSLQKNITQAVPGLITELQAAPGSVVKAFKLYHNLNVVYEFLNSLSEAAGAYGKREEYDPLSSDVSGLDRVRQNLSDYIEHSATNLEMQLKKPAPTNPAATQNQQAPKKVIIDDSTPTATKKKKKKPSPVPPAAPNQSQ